MRECMNTSRLSVRTRGGGETERIALSRAVHAFTRDTQKKRRVTSWNEEEVKATLSDLCGRPHV